MHVMKQDQLLTEQVIEIVVQATRTDRMGVMASGRGLAHISKARQLAMYLSHVVLGLSFAKVGALFQRDKTTVAHAVHQIEDERDDDAFDVWLSDLEDIVDLQVKCRRNLPALFRPRQDRARQETSHQY